MYFITVYKGSHGQTVVNHGRHVFLMCLIDRLFSERCTHCYSQHCVSTIEKRVTSSRKLYDGKILLNFSKIGMMLYGCELIDSIFQLMDLSQITKSLQSRASNFNESLLTFLSNLLFINFITCYKELRIFQVVGLIESVQQNVPVSDSTPIYIY